MRETRTTQAGQEVVRRSARHFRPGSRMPAVRRPRVAVRAGARARREASP